MFPPASKNKPLYIQIKVKKEGEQKTKRQKQNVRNKLNHLNILNNPFVGNYDHETFKRLNKTVKPPQKFPAKCLVMHRVCKKKKNIFWK